MLALEMCSGSPESLEWKIFSPRAGLLWVTSVCGITFTAAQIRYKHFYLFRSFSINSYVMKTRHCCGSHVSVCTRLRGDQISVDYRETNWTIRRPTMPLSSSSGDIRPQTGRKSLVKALGVGGRWFTALLLINWRPIGPNSVWAINRRNF